MQLRLFCFAPSGSGTTTWIRYNPSQQIYIFDHFPIEILKTTVATCPATAIWSILNYAAVDHHTILKSPSQITKDADNVCSGGGHLFPK